MKKNLFFYTILIFFFTAQGCTQPKIKASKVAKTSEVAPVTFEVDNSFDQEQISKGKGLVSRHKAVIKDMKISVRATMNNRPSKHSYRVKVETYLDAVHDCKAKNKTSYRAKGCNKVPENRKISTDEIILEKKNNWSSTFKIEAQVTVHAVKETYVARYEINLEKLEINPKLVSIEAID